MLRGVRTSVSLSNAAFLRPVVHDGIYVPVTVCTYTYQAQILKIETKIYKKSTFTILRASMDQEL